MKNLGGYIDNKFLYKLNLREPIIIDELDHALWKYFDCEMCMK